MYYIGIDPGKTGAIAIVDSNMVVVELHDFPGDEFELSQLFENFAIKYGPEGLTAALEDVHSMPTDRPKSAFSFGANFGMWRMGLATSKIPFHRVTPQTWQKGLLKSSDGNTLEMKRAAAKRLFPSADIGAKAKGRADALLIAYWRLVSLAGEPKQEKPMKLLR